MSHPPASESWYKWIAFRYGGQSRAGGSPRHFYAWIHCGLSIKQGVPPEMPPCGYDRVLNNNQSSHISMNLLSVNT